MGTLTFTSVYGDETRTVEIRHPSGSGGLSYVINENNFYLGQVINYITGWTVVSQKDEFTTDDQDAILDRMIEAGMFEVGDNINRAL